MQAPVERVIERQRAAAGRFGLNIEVGRERAVEIEAVWQQVRGHARESLPEPLASRVVANERRVRLGVWAGYELPDLGLQAAAPVASTFEAVYWDTPDLRLLRRGVTVREEGGEWTLREPDGRQHKGGQTLFGNAVVLGWTRGEPLGEVARLATERESFAPEIGRAHV